MKVRRKLIEVSLPLEKINTAAAREKSIRNGHPSTLHLWWARRPLAAARAVIFAQLVDDPSEYIDDPTAAEAERQRLHRLIEQLVLWENTANDRLLGLAREEIRKSWRRTCADNADHPRAKELFDPERLPAFHDPFAGGGALPFEAQRLGMEVYASDLNPVAVLINKAMVEIPPKFAGCPPVNPEVELMGESWKGARGLAEDVRYYGKWMRDEAERRIGHLYPKVQVTADMARDRPDLKPYVGRSLTVIAWIWARTVASTNPAFAHVQVPLVSTFLLSAKSGREAYIEPVVVGDTYRFEVKVGKPTDLERAKRGTKLVRGANFECILSGVPIEPSHIYSEANAGRMGTRLMAIVVEGDRRRIYLSPIKEHEALARVEADWSPDLAMPDNPRWFSPPLYGLKTYGDLFTGRQLVALTTLSDLIGEARERVRSDADSHGIPGDYAEAVATYLSFALSKQADLGNSLCRWEPVAQCPRQLFGRQAIPMVWDYAEGNPLGDSSGSWIVFIEGIAKAAAQTFASAPPANGVAIQEDAAIQTTTQGKVVSTDPPYYDNIGYAGLSDFFYVWLRRSLRETYSDLFSTVATPKAEELVAAPYLHGGKVQAERFFLDGMTKAMRGLVRQSHPASPITIYYAFKQSETGSADGVTSTGWETFLEAVMRAEAAVTGTWPLRTENKSRMVGQDTNALASSIVLVCRPRELSAATTSRREFVSALKVELPRALAHLQGSNIAPVDLAQAAIGPGMAVFTRYAKVLDAQGKQVSVREALALINRTLDEALAEQEGDFDADSRWALAWFEQFGFGEGDFGTAEQLSKSKATSVEGMVRAGILKSGRGRVRLLQPAELDAVWDPATDRRRPAWQAVHQLVRAADDSEIELAALIKKLGAEADTARELAYRLYVISERKGRNTEALWYNALVQSWSEAQQLAAAGGHALEQTAMFTEA